MHSGYSHYNSHCDIELDGHVGQKKISLETGNEHMAAQRNIRKEYKILLENSPLGIVLTDPQGQFLYVNRSFREMLGYSEQELMGKRIVDVTHPDSIPFSLEAIKKVYANEETATIEKQYLHKDGRIIDAMTRIAAVFDDHHQPLYQCTNIEDITEQKRANQKLIYQASHDDLTQLFNRREFTKRAEQLILACKTEPQEHALLFMDLDQFKLVNDTCGHAAGDELLRQLGATLKNILRTRDTLARLGGDEFGILVEHCSLNHAMRIASLVQKIVREFRFSWKTQTFKIGVSIGLAAINETTPNFSTLLRDADTACYLAKDMGRNRIHVYHPEDSELTKRHDEARWVVRLNQALDENKFRLYAQSIAPINAPIGNKYELLLRLADGDQVIPPNIFLTAAERYNMMPKLDRWVMRSAFQYFTDNPAFLGKSSFCSINLSGQSLTEPEFLDYTITQLDHFAIDPQKICFELTETAAISNLSTAIKFIATLKGLGCWFALDDFGSGLSSFAYLKNLAVDYLKIDGLFIRNILDNPIDRTMVKCINEMSQAMGMQTIAEFVENHQTKEILRDIGINYAQGYAIGKPTALSDFSQHWTS